MKINDIVRFWRRQGGWARAYWLDISDGKNKVRIKPVALKDAVPIWVDIDDVCCVEIAEDIPETEAQFIAKAIDSHKCLINALNVIKRNGKDWLGDACASGAIAALSKIKE